MYLGTKIQTSYLLLTSVDILIRSSVLVTAESLTRHGLLVAGERKGVPGMF